MAGLQNKAAASARFSCFTQENIQPECQWNPLHPSPVVHFSHGSKPGLGAFTWLSPRNNGGLDQHLKKKAWVF